MILMSSFIIHCTGAVNDLNNQCRSSLFSSLISLDYGTLGLSSASQLNKARVSGRKGNELFLVGVVMVVEGTPVLCINLFLHVNNSRGPEDHCEKMPLVEDVIRVTGSFLFFLSVTKAWITFPSAGYYLCVMR